MDATDDTLRDNALATTAPAAPAAPVSPTPPAYDANTLLSTWLSLTSDAALAFDATGTILLANDEAQRVFAAPTVSASGLVGLNMRQLLPPTASPAQEDLAPLDLPFPSDGSSARIMRSAADGQPLTLSVRCERIAAATDTYLLVAHPDDTASATSREHERLVEELSRANRRLAGTLDIVLGTLDSPSVGTLFERVLEKLCQTMDASGSLVYLYERGGFHLQGTSRSLADAAVPRFLPRKRQLVRLVTGSEHAVRLRVLPPESESLRRGKLSHRQVMDERTHETYRVRTDQLPPFASFMSVPVRFGGRVIALIEVGWRSARVIPSEDASLLDAVTRYLSVQLVGAFSALHTQRREQLAARANDLRDELVANPLDEQAPVTVFDAVAHDLDCVCAPIDTPRALSGSAVIHLPASHGEAIVPATYVSARRPVTPLDAGSELSQWLAERGEPCIGALVDVSSADDLRMRFLALRPADEEPFDDLELDYLHQVTDTIEATAAGAQGRRQDHRISQALQQGMRSELQRVEGISASGIYSSATKAAFVGGDFYDLIALPDRRACVIMGDVSGKGVEAASVSAAVRTALGAYSWEGLEPARMVELLNDFLLGFARIETFATLFVGIVDRTTASLTYCLAGHPPAVLLRAATGGLEWLGVQSGVVGAFRDMNYQNGYVTLGEGDVLLLYTDGTTEARATDGSFFGEEGLRDALMAETPAGYDGLLDRLLARLDAFTSNNLDDDVAMVALRFDELGA